MSKVIERFRELHAAGCFVIRNPDIGSARLLEGLDFPRSRRRARIGGRRGAATPHHEMTTRWHFRAISSAVAVPVNGDFEGGFATAFAGVVANFAKVAATGVVGLSIEDSTGNTDVPLFEFSLAVERVRAAREAAPDVVLTGRCEAFLVGRPDLDETIRRLLAYSGAGADCLYAPGLRKLDDIRAVIDAVAPKPVNVLVSSDFTTVAEMASLGARRISVGGALARAAWKGFLDAATEIAELGTFVGLAKAIPFAEINAKF
jgi:methylisocitrate lyase